MYRCGRHHHKSAAVVVALSPGATLALDGDTLLRRQTINDQELSSCLECRQSSRVARSFERASCARLQVPLSQHGSWTGGTTPPQISEFLPPTEPTPTPLWTCRCQGVRPSTNTLKGDCAGSSVRHWLSAGESPTVARTLLERRARRVSHSYLLAQRRSRRHSIPDAAASHKSKSKKNYFKLLE